MFLGMRYSTPTTIEDITQNSILRTIKLGRKVLKTNYQRWDLTIALEPDYLGMKKSAAKLQSHIAKHGDHTSFTISFPQHLGVEIPSSATGSGALGAARLTISRAGNQGPVGPPGGSPGSAPAPVVIPEGAFFTLSGDKKVYVTRSSGSSAVDIYPALRIAASNKSLDFSPSLTAYYSEDFLKSTTYTRGSMNQFVISVEEAI